MRYSNQGRFRQQVRFVRRQFLQDGDLPFSNVLSERTVAQALRAIQVFWMDGIYSSLVTLWVFLGQVLSEDHSCRSAVARLIAHRISRGQSPCSSETGAYRPSRSHTRHRPAIDQLQRGDPDVGSLPTRDCYPRPTGLRIPYESLPATP